MNSGAGQPLQGMRIVITRSKAQADEFANQIRSLGGEPVLCPVIQTVPWSDRSAQEALARTDAYDWLLFTSVNGVKFFFDMLDRFGVSPQQFAGAKVGAVGPKTAAALERRGFAADFIPEVYTGDEMANGLLEWVRPGERVLLPRARVARDVLPETLRQRGVHVEDMPVYETVLSDEGAAETADLLRRGRLDAVTFTSSSTVGNFLEVLRRNGMEQPIEAVADIPTFSIGPLTSGTARRLGFRFVYEAEEATVESLIQAILTYRKENGGENP